MMMTIVIVGAGALGSLFGALLAQSGRSVWLYNPSFVEHIAAVRDRGSVTVRTAAGDLDVPINATTDVDEIEEPIGLALVTVKTYDTADAARTIAPLITGNALVLSLQNGVGVEATLASHVPERRILRGVTAQGANIVEPGRVRWAGDGPTVIGAYRPAWQHTDVMDSIVEMFDDAGIDTELVDDIEPHVYGKLLVNAVVNPLTAMFDVPNGDLVEDDDLRGLLRDLVRETHPVVARHGVDWPLDEAIERVETVCRNTASNVSSMRHDVRRGRPTEIGNINGAVVREARELGIATPLSRLLLEWISRQPHGG